MKELFGCFIPGPPVGWASHEGFGRRAKMKPNQKAWQTLAIVEMRKKWGQRAPIGHEVAIEIVMITTEKKRTQRPDLTNVVKLTEDALTRAGVIHDDALVVDQRNAKMSSTVAKGVDINLGVFVRVLDARQQ